MTPDERKILEDAQDQVFQTSQDLADAQAFSGIRPPPNVEETESTLDGQAFGFDFAFEPTASAMPGPSAPPLTVTCPTEITVTFSGVQIDCGCISASPGSYEITDVGLFNDIPMILCPDPTCDPLPDGVCVYDNFDQSCTGGSCDQLTYHVKDWFSVTDCSGSPDADLDRNNCDSAFAPYVVLIGGVWYVVVIARGALVFYGTTTNVALPINNEVVCSDTLSDWDDPTFCGILQTSSYKGAGHDGTATITL